MTDVDAMIDRMLGRSNELKPCPSCGGNARIADETDWVDGRSLGGRWKYVYCQKCGKKTDRYFWDDREAMIKDWNEGVINPRKEEGKNV